MNDRPRPWAGGPPPEEPRSEPEIIPPSGARRRTGGDGDVFVYLDEEGRTHRVHVKTPGPLTIVLVLLAVGLVAALLLALVLGALFFLIPIAAVALAGLVAYVYARGFWQRLRGHPPA